MTAFVRMVGVRRRHWWGALVAGVAAAGSVLVLSSWYSVAGGYPVLGPYQGIGTTLGFSGNTATTVGVSVDILIPIVVALVMVSTLALLSRTRLTILALTSHVRALVEGALLGVVVWAVFYVPVLEDLNHGAPLSSLAQPLLFGLAEHVLFGAIIGVTIFLIGGPVTFLPEPGSPSALPAQA